MSSHIYRTVDVPVRGGLLRVGVWEPVGVADPETVLAVHGITASHRAWPAIVEALPRVRLIAPDLRGRGRSNVLPGPYGMAQHADDLLATLDLLHVPDAVVVGHSMGGFVAVVFAHRNPSRVRRIVLVDGGIPLPAPAGLPVGTDPEVLLQVVLGPAAERLSLTFPDEAAYLRFWRAHPAFQNGWSDAVADYVGYDLDGTAPRLRSSSSYDAVAADSLELYAGGPVPDALAELAHETTLLRAPRGLLDEPIPLYPRDHLAAWQELLPLLAVRDVPDVNHYTIIMSPTGVAEVAAEIRAGLDVRLDKEVGS